MFFINIKLRRDYRNTLVAADHKGSCQNLRHHRIFRHHRHHFLSSTNVPVCGFTIWRGWEGIFPDIDNELSLNFKSAIRSFVNGLSRPTGHIQPHGCVPTARTTISEIDKRLTNPVFFQQFPYFSKRISFPVPAEINV